MCKRAKFPHTRKSPSKFPNAPQNRGFYAPEQAFQVSISPRKHPEVSQKYKAEVSTHAKRPLQVPPRQKGAKVSLCAIIPPPPKRPNPRKPNKFPETIQATTRPTKHFWFPYRPPITTRAPTTTNTKHRLQKAKNRLSGFGFCTQSTNRPTPTAKPFGFPTFPTAYRHPRHAPARWAVLRQCGRENPIYHLTVITVDG